MEELNFDVTSSPPEPQARTAKVAETEFMEPLTIPLGTDVRPIALSLVPYELKVKELIAQAKEIVVEDDAGRKQATALGLQGKKLRLLVEGIKKSPSYLAADAYIKDCRHLCNTLTEPLKQQVEQVCKDKLTAYSKKLILEQQRREAEARERARKLQAELDAEAEKLKAEAAAKAKAAQDELDRLEKEEAAAATGPMGGAIAAFNEPEKEALRQTIEDETAAAESIVAPQVVVETQAPQNVVRTEAGASFTTSRWKARLVDINLVDRKYLVVDSKAVQRDVDGGMRTIDGFAIEQDLSTSLRG